MKIPQKLIASTLFIISLIASATMFSQQVVIENNIERISGNEYINDGNALSSDLVRAASSTQKSKKKKSEANPMTVEEASEILREGGGLRFRKKRNSDKCFIAPESEEKCSTDH